MTQISRMGKCANFKPAELWSSPRHCSSCTSPAGSWASWWSWPCTRTWGCGPACRRTGLPRGANILSLPSPPPEFGQFWLDCNRYFVLKLCSFFKAPTCLPKLQTFVDTWIVMFSGLSYLQEYRQIISRPKTKITLILTSHWHHRRGCCHRCWACWGLPRTWQGRRRPGGPCCTAPDE